MADSQQLNHMLMNIILNAVQAMEEKGRLTVKSYLAAENDKVRIEVADTGPGIPEDIVSHIFEPFFTTKEEGKGTGLGLSLAYSIVENHGGIINVKSKPGKGTTFIIDLPYRATSNKGDKSGD
jgi:signal transduction histidine kinase